ncbi:uncharacterized protein [Miscanthus floridulus]|uniref:uncharacterized protein isoform X2 n=1 Tax=Miscanthus floridulus TaxID=154761 RepID=UPI0034586DA9
MTRNVSREKGRKKIKNVEKHIKEERSNNCVPKLPMMVRMHQTRKIWILMKQMTGCIGMIHSMQMIYLYPIGCQDLETIVSKQTVEFGTKLANHGIHVDECIRKLRHRLEEFKAGVMVDVVFLKEECLERAAVGQEGTEVLEEKNLKSQDDLIGKVQQTQYNVVKTTAIAAVVLGAVVFVVLHVKRGG